MVAARGWDAGLQVAAVGRQYAQVAANQVAAALAAATSTGAAGDSLDWLWIFPATTTPGVVSLLDNALVLWSWPGGLTLSDVRPIFVPLNLRSVNGAWKVTTPANASVLAAGIFS